VTQAVTERRQQLAANLEVVQQRVGRACAAAGRDPARVTTVVVTKTFPVSDLRILVDLGVRELGESRDQEAAAKAAELAVTSPPPLTWHFVGQLQTNKASSVARYASVVHSVDRGRLVTALSRGAVRAERQVQCLLQVSLDRDVSRGGVTPEGLPALADAVVAAEGLELRGVMSVAPTAADPAEAFERLAELAAELQEQHPRADWISAGMSGDLEQAVAAGATHLRVGGAVLGSRPVLG
jgi:PLP dependent protein